MRFTLHTYTSFLPNSVQNLLIFIFTAAREHYMHIPLPCLFLMQNNNLFWFKREVLCYQLHRCNKWCFHQKYIHIPIHPQWVGGQYIFSGVNLSRLGGNLNISNLGLYTQGRKCVRPFASTMRVSLCTVRSFDFSFCNCSYKFSKDGSGCFVFFRFCCWTVKKYRFIAFCR